METQRKLKKRADIYFYRLQTKLRNEMFLHLSVSHSVHREDVHPRTRRPHQADTPAGGVCLQAGVVYEINIMLVFGQRSLAEVPPYEKIRKYHDCRRSKCTLATTASLIRTQIAIVFLRVHHSMCFSEEVQGHHDVIHTRFLNCLV